MASELSDSVSILRACLYGATGFESLVYGYEVGAVDTDALGHAVLQCYWLW